MNAEALDAPVFRMSRQRWHAIVASGALDGEHVELIEGQIRPLAPEYAPHAAMIDDLMDLFVARLPAHARVRVQHPLLVGEDSEPEPDIALVPRAAYCHDHPSSAFLVIEVADSSLRYDRKVKTPLYASATIPESWIVNLRERVIEVHTAPMSGRYTEVRTLSAGTLAPQAFPDITLDVAALFPPA